MPGAGLFERLAWALQQDLKAPDRWVLFMLAYRSGSGGEDIACYPSVRDLAEGVGVSPSTIQRAVTRLEQANLIAVFESAKWDGESTNIYVLNLWCEQRRHLFLQQARRVADRVAKEKARALSRAREEARERGQGAQRGRPRQLKLVQ